MLQSSKFDPEGQLIINASTDIFPPNKSVGLSARSCVKSQLHEVFL